MKSLILVLISVIFCHTAQAQINPVPSLNRVVWVWLENVDSQSMSYQKFVRNLGYFYPTALFSSVKAPSQITQTNDMTLIAGTDFGITDNSLTRIANPTILDLLNSKNIPWTVYAEDYPGACYLGEGSGNYMRYRVPFLSISHVQSDRYQCMKIVSLKKYFEDLQFGLLPQFSIIIPNIKNSGASSNAVTADATLKQVLGDIVSAPDFTTNTTVFIISINQTTPGPSGLFTAIVGAGVQVGVTNVTTSYNLVSVLKTLEVGLNLGNLHQQDEAAEPLVGFWK